MRKSYVNNIQEKEMKCDVCSIDMTTDGNYSTIGQHINLDGRLANPEVKRVKEMFGKTNFGICFCCLLKSLGMKENGQN